MSYIFLSLDTDYINSRSFVCFCFCQELCVSISLYLCDNYCMWGCLCAGCLFMSEWLMCSGCLGSRHWHFLSLTLSHSDQSSHTLSPDLLKCIKVKYMTWTDMTLFHYITSNYSEDLSSKWFFWHQFNVIMLLCACVVLFHHPVRSQFNYSPLYKSNNTRIVKGIEVNHPIWNRKRICKASRDFQTDVGWFPDNRASLRLISDLQKGQSMHQHFHNVLKCILNFPRVEKLMY